MSIDHQIAKLARIIERARRAIVFTGAGINTESGIPDFRSPGGIWTKMAPIDFSDFLASEEARRETWRRRFEADDMWRGARPNRGHRAVSELVRRGTAAAVTTDYTGSGYETTVTKSDGTKVEVAYAWMGRSGGYIGIGEFAVGENLQSGKN